MDRLYWKKDMVEIENCRLGYDRVDRYTGYIQYTGICLDTGIGDMTI
jgi:hypothetical protein